MQKGKYNPELESGNAEQFPENLFEHRDAVVLAETFHGQHGETVLNFLDKFGHQINGVFIELPADYQDSVDTYMAQGEVDEKLENFFVGAEEEGKNIRNLLNIFDKIKEVGKEVVCFDSSKTKEGEYQKTAKRKSERYFLRGESRDEDMFVNFERQYERRPGKYLLIVGANHVRESGHSEGDEKLGARLRRLFGEKYVSFEMPKEKT